MDARERLRRYLEQRRELGESELVLDKMSVDDVLSLVSAKGALRKRTRSDTEAPAVPPRVPEPRGEASDEPERPRSALPTAFQPQPDEADQDDAAEDEDPGAPADHPRLRGEGAPGGQDVRPASPATPEPAAPEVEERGGRAQDLLLDGADAGDWRTTLRAGGGLPTSRTPQPPDVAPEEARSVPAPRPSAQSDTASDAPPDVPGDAPRIADKFMTGTPFPGLDDVSVGVVFDGATAPLFGDQISALPSLDAIADTVRQCTRCPLYKTATHGVPGEGNPEADFVVVGEAPGADEDASGRPFVGASGQLLTKILAAINLAREDVFICNVVKHRPPGNRNPAPEEVSACSPYLVRQLELLRPKVILTVGNFAAQTLLNTKLGIGKLRGSVHLYRGVPLVATYHPAALLRNPTWKRPTWEDVQLARRLLDRPAGAG